jgi:hypothetical protein
MSEHRTYFFPADPISVQPHLGKLRDELLARGYILPAKGVSTPARYLWELRDSLAKCRPDAAPALRDIPLPDGLGMRQLIDGLKQAGIVPHDFYFAHDHRRGKTTYQGREGAYDNDPLSLAVLVDEMRTHGFVPADFMFVPTDAYAAGPLYYVMHPDAINMWPVPREAPEEAVWFEDYGDEVRIHTGENFSPPVVPGTGRTVEDADDFLNAWIDDPSTRWRDAQTGHEYGLWDLDFQRTLGGGRCAVVLKGSGMEGTRFAELLEMLTGQVFQWSREHL